MKSVFQMFESPIYANIFKLQAAKDILCFITQCHGQDHELTMEAKELQADAYEASGKAADGASLRLEVAEKRLKQQQDLGGFDHPHTFTAMEEVARLYEVLGRNSEADSLRASTAEKRVSTAEIEKRLQAVKKSSAPVDQATLVAYEDLAWVYESQNRKSDANVLRWEVADDQARYGNGQLCLCCGRYVDVS
jgi:hypothetical protein